VTPSRVLLIAAFKTLCVTYLGIDSEFDMWNYFFCVWRQQDLDVVVTDSRGAVIHASYGHGVDP
jgi:hypothetical protein